MNQGKSDVIAKRKVQALFRNKQKYIYHNHMQIMLMNINDITILRKKGGLIRVKESLNFQLAVLMWHHSLDTISKIYYVGLIFCIQRVWKGNQYGWPLACVQGVHHVLKTLYRCKIWVLNND